MLPIAALAIDTYTPGSADDPQVRYSHYLDADKRHFSALIELRQLAGSDDPQQLSTEYQWRLADNYLGFGMRDRAEAMYRSIASRAPEPKKFLPAQLQLAEFDFQRGYYGESRATLYRIREKLPKEMIPEWQDLLIRVLLAEGKPAEAAEVALKEDNASKQSPFTRYNLAIALIASDRVEQGERVLDDVGRIRPSTKEELELRDRANLALGWHFLQKGQGATAKPIFSRVRIEGASSNRALLGLGWSEVAPQGVLNARPETPDASAEEEKESVSSLGALLRPGFLDNDIYARAGMRNFRLKNGDPKTEAALKRALVPWVELLSRDPMDPAVLEAWLAIPYTLDNLGAHTQALQYYEKAVEVLEESHKRMGLALSSIKQGRMVETIVHREQEAESGWDWRLRDLPDAPETYFLQTLLAEHRFQEALKNYRDLRMLSRNLEAWRARLDVIERTAVEIAKKPVDIDTQLKNELQDSKQVYSDVKIPLKLDTSLAAPGSYQDRPAPAEAPAPVAATPVSTLVVAKAPEIFEGSFERTQTLRIRLGNLRGQVKAALVDQAQQLQTISTKELEGQRKQIERYLVEARFALARLYDRQKKGELDRE